MQAPTPTSTLATSYSTFDVTQRRAFDGACGTPPALGHCTMCTSISTSSQAGTPERLFKDFMGELSCVICLEPFKQPVTLACSHTFCRECILRALSVAPSCPLCKMVTARRGLKEDAFVAELVKAAVQQRDALHAGGWPKEPALSRSLGDQQVGLPPALLGHVDAENQRAAQPSELQAHALSPPARHPSLFSLQPSSYPRRRTWGGSLIPSRRALRALRPCAHSWMAWCQP